MNPEKNKEEKKTDALSEEVQEFNERGFFARASLFFLEMVKLIVLAGITIGLVRYFLFKPFIVKGQSMEPSFAEKDYLIIDELTYRFREPERGEVVVFESPIGDDAYLKRVIGLPGERVKIEQHKVIIYNEEHPQGIVVQEDYLTENTPGTTTITLGAQQYFVMGDNRDASYDSRRFGPVDISDIVGRVWVRGWPISKAGTFDVPSYNL